VVGLDVDRARKNRDRCTATRRSVACGVWRQLQGEWPERASVEGVADTLFEISAGQ